MIIACRATRRGLAATLIVMAAGCADTAGGTATVAADRFATSSIDVAAARAGLASDGR